MSRASNKVTDLEELNHKLEQTIHNLHSFAGRLAGLHDKREAASLAPGNNTTIDRPRAMFFAELEQSISKLAGNLGFLDGLVSSLEIEVFGEPAPPTLAPEADYTRHATGVDPRAALQAKGAQPYSGKAVS